MKLDMDMVKRILEAQEADIRYEEPIHAFGTKEAEHYRILVEAGFVRSTGKIPSRLRRWPYLGRSSASWRLAKKTVYGPR